MYDWFSLLFAELGVISGFVEMKTELKDYLKKFAENGKVGHNH
jgi:hypothetical protein